MYQVLLIQYDRLLCFLIFGELKFLLCPTMWLEDNQSRSDRPGQVHNDLTEQPAQNMAVQNKLLR
jgi:hypothetical protein